MRHFFTKHIIVLCISILSFFSAKTQTDTAFQQLLDSINLDDIFGKEVKKSSFKIQTSYLTNYVYGGRKDSSTLYPYFTPSLEYTHKSGFFVGGSFSFLTNDNSRLDATNLELGYSTDSIGKFSLSAYLNKSFYNSKSQNVQSDVGLTVGAQIGYDAKIVNIIAAPSLMIGSNKDFALTLSVEKLIYLKETDKSTLSINPNIATYFGGTGFYQSNKLRGKKNSAPQQGATLVVTSPKKFQMLSYEFGLPIYFDKEKWGLFITPTYAIAVNPVVASYKLVGPNGNQIPGANTSGNITEKIENSFFAEIGLYYKF
jgi:hypothetical protein